MYSTNLAVRKVQGSSDSPDPLTQMVFLPLNLVKPDKVQFDSRLLRLPSVADISPLQVRFRAKRSSVTRPLSSVGEAVPLADLRVAQPIFAVRPACAVSGEVES